MPIGEYEPKRSRDCLNLAKKSVRIIVLVISDKLGISMDTVYRFWEMSDESSTHVLGQGPALVYSGFRHLGEYLISDGRLKHLEVVNIMKFLSVEGHTIINWYSIISKGEK